MRPFALWFLVHGRETGSHQLYRAPTHSQLRLGPRLAVVTLPAGVLGMDWCGRLVWVGG